MIPSNRKVNRKLNSQDENDSAPGYLAQSKNPFSTAERVAEKLGLHILGYRFSDTASPENQTPFLGAVRRNSIFSAGCEAVPFQDKFKPNPLLECIFR
jgi:hypothetical protein